MLAARENDAELSSITGSNSRRASAYFDAVLDWKQLEEESVPYRILADDIEKSLRDYPLVTQSAAAYRTHVGEQRDFLKWIAAFASAGLFLVLNQLRSAGPIDAVGPPVIACFAFLISVFAAGFYWWRVDLSMGRYLEAVQHRVGIDVIGSRELLLRVAQFKEALETPTQTNLVAANAAFHGAKRAGDELLGRGELPRPQLYESERLAVVLKGLCVGGYALGVVVVIVDQLLRLF